MYKAPRGTADILPDEQPYWSLIERKAAETCRLYGYERIDTPVFEDTGLFARSIGEETDIVAKEMYTFEDRGGNQVTLRPEGTAPVCRAYLEHGLSSRTKPVKLYYLAPIFRYERPQSGRYRQHHQFGYEAIGDGDAALDAEAIDMAWRFFASFKLTGLSIQLNSIGCRQDRPEYIKALKAYYAAHLAQLCPDCNKRYQRNPLRLLDCKKPVCTKIAAAAPKNTDYLCPECVEHFSRLTGLLEQLKLPFVLNHRLVRGLDYYTRTVFEIQPEGQEAAQSTLGGGGRYDDLIEQLGGQPTPAVGFATGLERIVLNIKKQGIAVPPPSGPVVFIACVGEKAVPEAIKLAASLRGDGSGVIQGSGGRSLKAQLRQADGLGAKYAVIIGEREVASGTVILRNMATSEQETVAKNELAARLK
jgi:histidyl-tRNA synthetase